MTSRWREDGARAAVARWGDRGEDIALRLYSARLIGADPSLVLHGGGNVSLKRTVRDVLGREVEAILVKGSGRDLAALEPHDLVALELEPLRRLRAAPALDDAAMTNELRRASLDASAPPPSIETLVHAFLPHRFVDHSHADAVVTLTNTPRGEELVKEAAGDGVVLVPYVVPGFELARALARAHAEEPEADAFLLLHHGLFTVGENARSSYERHVEVVEGCRRLAEARVGGRRLVPVEAPPGDPAERAAWVAPLLRGLLARPTGDEDRPWRAPILEWRGGRETLRVLAAPEAAGLAASPPLVTDHLIRTRTHPLFVPDPPWDDPGTLRERLSAAVETYREEYRRYLSTHSARAATGAATQPAAVRGADPSPAVVLLPGAGAFCWGPSKREARIAADITERTLAAKERAHFLGGYRGLSPDHLFAMEFRGLQLAKKGADARPLTGRVVAISGGAGAIGAAVAEVCAEAGAHVLLADLDEERLARTVEDLGDRHGAGRAAAVATDVTDPAAVEACFARCCQIFGGLDVLVPNAGIARAAPLDCMEPADFQRVVEINLHGYFLFLREGIRLLKTQGLGGHIVINASKNVFAPGREFGAYSASKAGGHQLGKVAALELAEHGIRVNMINADGIFGDEDHPSGLWREVGPERARARGVPLEELPEFYRRRNLLKARVTGRHVGNAVVFFASGATPTTGATLPVDGGLPEAFPR